MLMCSVDLLRFCSQVAACTWCVLVHSASSNGAGCVAWSGTESVWATTGSDKPHTPLGHTQTQGDVTHVYVDSR